MKNTNGFTLIEVLIVLSASIVLLSIGSLFQTHVIKHYQEDQFLQLFQSDVLYMQYITLIKRETFNMTIHPDQHNYIIRKGGTGKIITKRNIPSNWNVQLMTLTMPISFTFNGTIKNPGMFSIKTGESHYQVFLPFGKGRGYIIEK
ncbi:competence type IV pilus minor pilin ComGD [Aquibacillus saliphilus]|uniref:competence type IV pilus minor pilin ComGD n=1 Tax=Aquibacillus saliphilus TaxID=1909422 RepID=UPI001CEFE394|nr:competence type IV pilus minor pilin ComGD [Aquibacillus saliphilus]